MALTLDHKKSSLYTLSKRIVYSCYELTQKFNVDEKEFISTQIKKAALIAHINITKALYGKKKKGKRKFFKTAMKAYVLVDAGLEMVLELAWATASDIGNLEEDVRIVFDRLRKKRKKYA